MKAVAGHYGMDDAACRAIEAGCDALLICSKIDLLEQAHAGLVRRAEVDREFAARLESAAARSCAARRLHEPAARGGDDLEAWLARTSAELESRLARAQVR
jgi:beta-N-acetylhexosaminidase